MKDNLGFALEGAWQVLLAGLILGAGLPALYAVGLRSLAWGAGGDAEVDPSAPNPLGKVLAATCFAIVLAAVVLGITVIVSSGFGKQVSFENVFPTLVDKH